MTLVALFTNTPAPYRAPLFEELSRRVNLTVFFGSGRQGRRRWHTDTSTFNGQVLRSIATLPYLYSVNPSLPFKLLKGGFDVYIAGGPRLLGTMVTLAVAKIRGKPFILWTGNRRYSWHRPRLLGRIVGAVARCVERHADACIAYGIDAAWTLLFDGVKPDRIHIAVNTLPYGELKERYAKAKPEELKKRLGIHRDMKVILSLCYLEKRKGVQVLLEAFARLKEDRPDVALVIAGDGPHVQHLKWMAEGIPDVHFTGYVPEEEKAAYYRMADVYVLPTLMDPWGLTVNEAMICETPVVTTFDAGAWQLASRCGAVVNSGDPIELYEALKELLSSDDELRVLGRRARRTAEKYTVRDMAEKFVEVIRNVV